MRIPTKQSKKPAILITTAVVALAGAGAGTFYTLSHKPFNNTATEAPKSSQNEPSKTTTTTKSAQPSTSTNSSDKADQPIVHEKEKDIQPAYQGENANSAPDLTGVITFSQVVDTNLIIRTTINQALSGGTCKLTLSNGQKTVTKESSIIPNPSSSTCDGFSIPVSELSSGDWTVSIALSGDSKTGTLSGNVKI